MRREKAAVVLQHLLRGGRGFRLPLGDEREPRTFVLSEDYELCQLVQKDNGEEVLLPVLGVDIGPFIKLCEKLSDDEVFSIGALTALAEINQRGRS